MNKTELAELTRALSEIPGVDEIKSFDAASIKTGIVLRLLSVLGWNPFNVSEVKPEYGVDEKKVDYALRIQERNLVFIEVKEYGDALKNHEEQLVKYSFLEQVKLAILTNGVQWRFYLPMIAGSWTQRRFLTLDLSSNETGDAVLRFKELLTRNAIDSGDAFDTAETLFKNRQRKALLTKHLPNAWAELIRAPSTALIKLLAEKIEQVAGFKPDDADVIKFLVTAESPACAGGAAPARGKANTMPWEQMTATAKSVAADYADRKLDSFLLLGTTFRPNKWEDLLVTVAGELYKRHQKTFRKYLSLSNTQASNFSTDRNLLKRPKRIGRTQFYAETKFDANQLVKQCHELLALFGYKDSDLELFTR